MVFYLLKGTQNQQQQQKPKSTSAPTHHSTPLTSGINYPVLDRKVLFIINLLTRDCISARKLEDFLSLPTIAS